MQLKNSTKAGLKGIDRTNIFWYAAAFVIPVLAVLIGYIRLDISPFGDNSLLSMDLWSQYFPMITEQYTTRRELARALFSWNGALGFNSFAQSSYYCNSLFNWLLLLAPRGHLIDALDYLILFKFGLAGLSMAFFLKHKTAKINPITVICSVGYALCAYNLAFINQVMWFDAVIFFPIILIGLERMLISARPALYCIMLAVTIYSSFYISFSICLFLVLYFLFFMLESYKGFAPKERLMQFVRFGAYSLISGLSVAFVILPIYKAIGLTIASEIPAPTRLEFYNSFIEYLAKLFPQTEVSLQYGIPNIYTGGVAFILIPLFYANKKIPVAKKLVCSGLLLILLLSMNLNVLDYIWHGFHFPNQLPGRWTFIFSFLLMYMSCEGFLKFKALERREIIISAAFSIAVVVLTAIVTVGEYTTITAARMAVIFIVIYAALFILVIAFKKDSFHRVLLLILCACIVMEVGSNAVYTLTTDTTVGSIKKYTQFDADMAKYTEKYNCSDDEFYRSEMYENWTFDAPQYFGYKGVTYYSSTMQGTAYEFFKSLGQRVYAKNVSAIFNPYSPVVNSVFGIKYIASRNMPYYTTGLQKQEVLGKFTVLENKYTLPLGFVADRAAADFEFSSFGSPIDRQQDMLDALCGEETGIYTALDWDAEEAENAYVYKSRYWNDSTYSREDSSRPVKFSFSYSVKQTGDYYYCNNFKKGDMTVKVDGKTHSPYVDRLTHEFLGHLKEGTKIEITVSVSEVGVGLYGLSLYSFDEASFAEKIKSLSSQGLKVTAASSSGIEASIDSRGGLVFTSIPDDGGFTVFVDGKEVEKQLFAEYLICFEVPSGQHSIEIKYSVPGLFAGLSVSVVFVVLFVLCLIAEGQNARKKLKKSQKS